MHLANTKREKGLRALLKQAESFGPQDTRLPRRLDNLAKLYLVEGRYAEAYPLYKRSLAIREKELDGRHPDVAKSVHDLAEIYRAQRKYAEAEPLYKRSLAIYEKPLGSVDRDNEASTLSGLAKVYQAQGRNTEAVPLIARSQVLKDFFLDAMVENGEIEPEEENKQALPPSAAYCPTTAYCLTAAMFGVDGKRDPWAIDFATMYGQTLIKDFDSELFLEVCNNPDRLPDIKKLAEAACEELEEEQRELIIGFLRDISELIDRSSKWKAYVDRVSILLKVTEFEPYSH